MDLLLPIVAVFGLYAWVLSWIVRLVTGRGEQDGAPQDKLRERYLRGDITKGEYERFRNDVDDLALRLGVDEGQEAGKPGGLAWLLRAAEFARGLFMRPKRPSWSGRESGMATARL